MTIERPATNGFPEASKLTGMACPKAAKRWLAVLNIHVDRHWVIDIKLYCERVRQYNAGLLKPTKKQNPK